MKQLRRPDREKRLAVFGLQTVTESAERGRERENESDMSAREGDQEIANEMRKGVQEERERRLQKKTKKKDRAKGSERVETWRYKR